MTGDTPEKANEQMPYQSNQVARKVKKERVHNEIDSPVLGEHNCRWSEKDRVQQWLLVLTVTNISWVTAALSVTTSKRCLR